MATDLCILANELIKSTTRPQRVARRAVIPLTPLPDDSRDVASFAAQQLADGDLVCGHRAVGTIVAADTAVAAVLTRPAAARRPVRVCVREASPVATTASTYK